MQDSRSFINGEFASYTETPYSHKKKDRGYFFYRYYKTFSCFAHEKNSFVKRSKIF